MHPEVGRGTAVEAIGELRGLTRLEEGRVPMSASTRNIVIIVVAFFYN